MLSARTVSRPSMLPMTFVSKDDLNDILVDWDKTTNSWNGSHTWLQPPGQNGSERLVHPAIRQRSVSFPTPHTPAACLARPHDTMYSTVRKAFWRPWGRHLKFGAGYFRGLYGWVSLGAFPCASCTSFTMSLTSAPKREKDNEPRTVPDPSKSPDKPRLWIWLCSTVHLGWLRSTRGGHCLSAAINVVNLCSDVGILAWISCSFLFVLRF